MPADDPSTLPRHPLRVVAERTGLEPALLRAWERRHDVVRPSRSDGGHRLYSDADVARLRLLRLATRAGRAIGQVAALSDAELAALVREDDRAALVRPPGADAGVAPDPSLAECLDAVGRLDAARLERALKGVALARSAAALTDDVVAPLLARLGALWRDGALLPAHEHLATAVVRRVLGWLADSRPAAPGAPVVVVGTTAGERHEMGAMLAAVTAGGEGWQVVYLGADLPSSDLAAAARETGARAVAVSAVLPASGAQLAADVGALAAALPPDVALIVGGGGAQPHAGRLRDAGAEVLADLPALRRRLRDAAAALQPPRGGRVA